MMEDEKKYTHPEQAMLALKMAIEEEMPKLKEGQKLKNYFIFISIFLFFTYLISFIILNIPY